MINGLRRMAAWMATAAILAVATAASAASPAVNSYSYDARGRLVTVVIDTGAGAGGVTTITYTYDAAGNRTQTVTSTSTNATPVAGADTVYTGVNTPLIFDPRANDTPLNQYLTISSITQPHHGTLVINPGSTTLTYTPTASYSGSDTFTYRVSNGFSTSTAVTDTIHVDNSPAAVADSIMMAINTPTTFSPLSNDSDPAGYGLAIIATTNGASGYVVNNGDGTLTYTPGAGFTGSDSFTYTVSDGHNASSTATVSVAVAQNPTAVADSAMTAENIPVTISPLSNDTDPASYPLTVSSASTPAHGAVSIINSGTQIKYTPTTNYIGTDSLVYNVSNGHGGTAQATISITVAATPPAPVAVGDGMFDQAVYTGGAGIAPTATIDPRTNDTSSGFPLTITGVTQGTKGTVTHTGTTVTYTYNTPKTHNFTDTDTFTYTISNGVGGTATGTVTVSIEVDTLQ